MAARATLSRFPRSLALTIGCTVAWPAPARAAPDTPAFVVSLSACDEIDRAALLSFLELEMSELMGGLRPAAPHVVELTCVGDRLHIRVHDPVRGKRLGRTVPRPPAEHGERSVALAISQLFLASRLERQFPSPPRAAGLEPTAGRLTLVPHAGPAVAAPAGAAGAFRPFGLGLRAGLGVRDPAAPILTRALALGGRMALDRAWTWTVAVGVEHGTARRERGTVEVWLGDVGLSADVTLLREGMLTVGLGASGGLVWSRLVGQPARDNVRGHSVESIGARLGLVPRVSLELDGLALSLAVEVGTDLGLPVGLVSEERAVTPGGFFGRAWLGVDVRFGD